MVASRLMAEPTHAVEPLPLHDGKTTVVSVISSSAAVLAACSCCILPMVLVAAGLSASLSSVLAALGSLHWPMTAFSMAQEPSDNFAPGCNRDELHRGRLGLFRANSHESIYVIRGSERTTLGLAPFTAIEKL